MTDPADSSTSRGIDRLGDLQDVRPETLRSKSPASAGPFLGRGTQADALETRLRHLLTPVLCFSENEGRDRHVLAGGRDDDERMEELVVAEYGGDGIRRATRVHERAGRIEHASREDKADGC